LPFLGYVPAQEWKQKLHDSPGWWPVTDLFGFDSTDETEATADKARRVAAVMRAWKTLLAEEERERERQQFDARTRKALADAGYRRPRGRG
jgi:hypothetical protein